MSKNAKAEFYWKDWTSEKCLRLCSLAARGLWMEMLCVAAEADPPGFVVIGSRPLAAGDLARISGATESEVEILLDELDRHGVFSRDSRNRIYCRRMVRDDKRRKTAQENGKLGGNPRLRNGSAISGSDNRTRNHHVKPPDKGADKGGHKAGVSPPIPLNHSTTSPPNHGDDGGLALERICAELGVTLTEDARRLNWPAEVLSMLDDGLSLDRDIIPACREAKARGIANLRWVRKAAETSKSKASIEAQVKAAPLVEVEHIYDDERGWKKRLIAYGETGVWPRKWGPKRGEPGHLCKEEYWAKYEHAKRERA